MFRMLADEINTKYPVPPTPYTVADAVFTFHPEQLSRWLEESWATGGPTNWAGVLDPTIQAPLGVAEAVSMFKLPGGLVTPSGVAVNAAFSPLPWGYTSGGTASKLLMWD